MFGCIATTKFCYEWNYILVYLFDVGSLESVKVSNVQKGKLVHYFQWFCELYFIHYKNSFICNILWFKHFIWSTLTIEGANILQAKLTYPKTILHGSLYFAQYFVSDVSISLIPVWGILSNSVRDTETLLSPDRFSSLENR